MQEIIQESIKGYNLPFTILLGGILIYWGIALLGVVDIDAGGDFDIDVDVDADADGADEVSPDSGDQATGNFLDAAMRFAGFSDAPIMFVLSLYVVFIWMCSMAANLLFNPASSTGVATLLLLPVLVISFIATRLLVRPLRPVMKMLRAKEAPAQIIGEQAIVRSATLSETFGRVEVDFDGRKLLLQAVASEGSPTISKGATVLVVSKKDDSDTYIVRPL